MQSYHEVLWLYDVMSYDQVIVKIKAKLLRREKEEGSSASENGKNSVEVPANFSSDGSVYFQ